MNSELRPKYFADFVGKEKIKSILSTMINGAKNRAESLDHILFSGNAGLGKTTLANIIANELGAKILTTIGNNIDNNIISTIKDLKDGDVIFIDEIHAVPKKWQELLYPALEDRKVSIREKGVGYTFEIEVILPRFTLIGATTEAGLLTKPLRDRFGASFILEAYSIDELATIVRKNIATLQLKTLSCDFASIATEVAKRSRGTPRIANNILRRVRDFGEQKEISYKDLIRVFGILGIREDGLDENDIKILSILDSCKQPLGVANISATTNIDRHTIETIIEPFLLSKGYLMRSARGRVITDSGKKKLKSITA